MELMAALVVAVTLGLFASYVSLPRRTGIEFQSYMLKSSFGPESLGRSSQPVTQQIIQENIQGELKKGEFENTIQGVKSLTSDYGGSVPVLHMGYDNDVWSGTLTCRVPTDNVTTFTFEVRNLINDHGKVTYISIDVTETEVNQSQTAETPLSEVNMYLFERAGGSSPLVDQLGGIVSVLTTGLVWIAEGIIVGVPLCFTSLGVVVLVDRGIIPVWKKQFRNKSAAKGTSESINS